MRDDNSSTETLIALLFAACILVALMLLTGCEGHVPEAVESRPMVRGNSIVFPAKAPDRFTRKPVRTGPEGEGCLQVLSGLQQGEDAILAGMLFLQQLVANAEGAPQTLAKAARAQ